MKILKTAQAYYPFQEKGGPAVKVRAIAVGLARRGHGVTVLTSDWGFRPSMAPAMSAEKCERGWSTEEQGVKAIFLNSLGRYRGLSLNPSMVSFCRESLSAYEFVHVYGLYDFFGPTAAFFCRKNRIPYVVEPMGMFRPIVRNIGLKKIYHRIFGKSLLAGAYLLIATSDQEKQELIDGGIDCERIVVRRNGVEAPQPIPERGTLRAEWQIPAQGKLILYLGRLERKKSPHLLLGAFAQWRRASRFGRDSVLVLAGPEQDQGYSARLRSQASSLGITSSVRFAGPLYDARKWSAYRDADVFVLPSQNENFGNSAAEAIACGTPVIVTDQCGIAPIVKDRAGLVASHDAASIAGALEIVLEDPNCAARLRNACPAVVKELSWDEPISEMVKIYRDGLAKAS